MYHNLPYPCIPGTHPDEERCSEDARGRHDLGRVLDEVDERREQGLGDAKHAHAQLLREVSAKIISIIIMIKLINTTAAFQKG